MTISKEERAELQQLLDGHSNGHPRWKTFGDDETDIGRVRGHQSIRGFHGDTLGSFYAAEHATLSAKAVNALQGLLDALDASDERIASLEAEAAATDRLFIPALPEGGAK